jgi:predicted nucleic-acid-binding protein
MLAADTNVWARAYLNDDATQAAKARSALARARSKNGVFVPLLVLAELSWVLRARWEKGRVLDTLDSLLQTRGVSVEFPALVRRALEAARTGRVGFADHLIREVAMEYGASEIITFDKDSGRKLHVRRLR